MAASNVVNLDALIKRADLAAPGEVGEDIDTLPITGLEPKGMLYPALRKPDFQRETASWAPDQVADLITTFVNRDLIPAVILWRAGNDVFVIDGAHRLSALVAWVHDDYGDGEVSRRFFQNWIPDDQRKAAERTRELVKLAVGSYQDHKMALDYPNHARADVAQRASRIAWQYIPAQWIRNADHDKAEKAFFRINQGGTKIDQTEKRILSARRSPVALAARAILRGGTGHDYWRDFDAEAGARIEGLGGEIHKLLFDPNLSLPIKTLDVPVAGQGYGPRVLPFVFDLVTVANRVATKASGAVGIGGDSFAADENGSGTLAYLSEVRRLLRRICSNDPSSLGLHPALYFYARSGTFQAPALLSFVGLILDWQTDDYMRFTTVRARFEEFLLGNRNITEAIRRLGSGSRSRPRTIAFYKRVLAEIEAGKATDRIVAELSADESFEFFLGPQAPPSLDAEDGSFSRDVKGAAFLRDAVPTAPRCPTCGGLVHRNGMQVGHQNARRAGGSGSLENAMIQHPFCNSTYCN